MVRDHGGAGEGETMEDGKPDQNSGLPNTARPGPSKMAVAIDMWLLST